MQHAASRLQAGRQQPQQRQRGQALAAAAFADQAQAFAGMQFQQERIKQPAPRSDDFELIELNEGGLHAKSSRA
ncbi:hypothetical protein GCM10027430_04090 [Lysobacter tyrosinilyticus]